MLPLSAERWLGFGLRRIVRGIAVSAYLGRVRLSHTAGEACWQLQENEIGLWTDFVNTRSYAVRVMRATKQLRQSKLLNRVARIGR